MQTAVFYCSRAVGRSSIAQGSGQVVNIASIRRQQGHPGRLAYCAAKAAVIMMTQVIGAELGPLGCVSTRSHPGSSHRGLGSRGRARLLREQQYLSPPIPVGRLATPHEVGQLCSYLASDESAYIVGSCVTIDGGMSGVPSG